MVIAVYMIAKTFVRIINPGTGISTINCYSKIWIMLHRRSVRHLHSCLIYLCIGYALSKLHWYFEYLSLVKTCTDLLCLILADKASNYYRMHFFISFHRRLLAISRAALTSSDLAIQCR